MLRLTDPWAQCPNTIDPNKYRNTKKPLYLDFIEEFSIEESELIGDLMTAEVMERSRPVRTQTISLQLDWIFLAIMLIPCGAAELLYRKSDSEKNN